MPSAWHGTWRFPHADEGLATLYSSDAEKITYLRLVHCIQVALQLDSSLLAGRGPAQIGRISLSLFETNSEREAWFLSRISNLTVLRLAARQPLSEVLLKRQVRLLEKVISSPVGNPLREVSFIGSTLHPASSKYIRKVGRPRMEWITSTMERRRLLC